MGERVEEIASAVTRKADTLKANTVYESERKVKDVYFIVSPWEDPFCSGYAQTPFKFP